MSLQCAPKPPLVLCHVRVFSTRPLLLHVESASLTANAAFLFIFYFSKHGLDNVRRNLGGWGGGREKREKMQMQADV